MCDFTEIQGRAWFFDDALLLKRWHEEWWWSTLIYFCEFNIFDTASFGRNILGENCDDTKEKIVGILFLPADPTQPILPQRHLYLLIRHASYRESFLTIIDAILIRTYINSNKAKNTRCIVKIVLAVAGRFVDKHLSHVIKRYLSSTVVDFIKLIDSTTLRRTTS